MDWSQPLRFSVQGVAAGAPSLRPAGGQMESDQFLRVRRETGGRVRPAQIDEKGAGYVKPLPRILRRWKSLLSNVRLEGLNGLFQAAVPEPGSVET